MDAKFKVGLFICLNILFYELLRAPFIHTHVVSHRDSFSRLVKGFLVGISKLALLRTVLLQASLFDSTETGTLLQYLFFLFVFSRKIIFTKDFSRIYTQNLLIRIILLVNDSLHNGLRITRHGICKSRFVEKSWTQLVFFDTCGRLICLIV